ncbi:MAG: peroxiredoxin-like family protein [Bacteroidales bacterium]
MKRKLFFILFLTGLSSGLQISAQIPEKVEDISPLLNGETIPNAVLIATDGKSHQISEIVGAKPTVLLFYRGGWCPYCNTHLAEIQEIETEIIELGYQIVAVSPDSPENLQETDEKRNLNYSLYSDADGTFIKGLGIAFKAPERMSDMLSDRSGGENAGLLPVPSVFIVDTSGKILFEYINPDYRTRLSAGLLIAVLKELKNSDS